MELKTTEALRDELAKIAQEGFVRRTARRASVASEFADPLAEAALAGLAARGLGVRDPRRILGAAGIGGVHGVMRKTRKFAG